MADGWSRSPAAQRWREGVRSRSTHSGGGRPVSKRPPSGYHWRRRGIGPSSFFSSPSRGRKATGLPLRQSGRRSSWRSISIWIISLRWSTPGGNRRTEGESASYSKAGSSLPSLPVRGFPCGSRGLAICSLPAESRCGEPSLDSKWRSWIRAGSWHVGTDFAQRQEVPTTVERIRPFLRNLWDSFGRFPDPNGLSPRPRGPDD